MNNKTLSMISYISILGWLISYFVGKDNAEDLLKYHLKQSLGLTIISLLFGIALSIVCSIVPSLYFLSFINIVFLILMILGIINAANEVKKPLPIIGQLFESKFAFIG